MSSSPKRSASTSVQSPAREAERLISSIREQLRKPVNAAFAVGELLRHDLGFAQSTVSGIVDRLVHRGRIILDPDPSDGRSILLKPSVPVRHFLNTRAAELSATPLAIALSPTLAAPRSAIPVSLSQLHALLQRSAVAAPK